MNRRGNSVSSGRIERCARFLPLFAQRRREQLIDGLLAAACFYAPIITEKELMRYENADTYALYRLDIGGK